MLALAQRYAHTRQIRTILYYPRFPVDIRHNAKIGREFLKRWASQRLGQPVTETATGTERVT